MATYVTDVLTATAATTTGSPTPTRTWQWLRGSTTISGATTNSYTVTAEDLGQPVTARQTETNLLGTASATSIADGSVLPFTPTALFALNEPGVWYDPSDITTLYTDNVGTTPVTTPGQTVGLMLDKSKGMVVGPELISNPSFDSGTNYSLLAGATISSGQLVIDNQTNSRAEGTGNFLPSGRWLQLEIDIASTTGSVGVILADNVGALTIDAGTFSAIGVSRRYIFSANTNGNFRVIRSTGASVVNSISFREISGNHATQTTLGQRPTYGIVPKSGRRNLLTWSEDFRNTTQAGENRPWTHTAVIPSATTEPAPNGTLTAWKIVPTTANSQHVVNSATFDTGTYTQTVYAKAAGYNHLIMGSNLVADMYAWFNLATGEPGTKQSGILSSSMTPVGNGWYRCQVVSSYGGGARSRSFAVATADNVFSFAGNDTSGIYLWGAQNELGSTATAYQKVTNTFDVTEAGVASVGYLAFDTDKWMVTNTITPGTDKAQMFAGVRKLADVAFGASDAAIIAEFGTSVIVTVGLAGSTGYNTGQKYSLYSKGTVAANPFTTNSAYTAPITNVITGLGDIAGDLATLRVDGTQVAQVTTDQGTGNYLAYPLYIGRRGGTSLPFNGHIYSLIVRFGSNLSAARISAAEVWISDKTAESDFPNSISPIIYTRSGDTILDRFNSIIERRAL